ncbi:MAG: FecR domain-containing protein [Balneolaceae bacterium]
MKSNSKNNGYKSSFPEDESLHEIWDISGKLTKENPVSETEVDAAWQSVSSKMDSRKRSNQGLISDKFLVASRFMMAAAVLLVIGGYLYFVPQTVTVPYGEMASVNLPDGSTAELNSGSTIRYQRFFWGDVRSVTLNGEAYFSVENNADKPFRVESNGVITEVVGTQFNIRSWEDELNRETELSVTEGEVSFYTMGDKDPVRVKSGQRSSWNPGLLHPTSPDSISSDDINAWRNNRLVFHDRALISILNDLERRFDVRIDLEATDLAGETLTAYYSNPREISVILDDISMVKGVQYSQTANGYRIFKQ